MLNDLFSAFNASSTNSNSDSSQKITNYLQTLTIMVVVLACTRLLSLDIFTLIGELLTALMIYFYSLHINKCMAIFCMISGVLGGIRSVMNIIHTISAMKENWFSEYYTLIFLIALYSLVVYSLICYFAYFGLVDTSTDEPGTLPHGSNYGAVDINNQNTKSFVPFDGKGTVLG